MKRVLTAAACCLIMSFIFVSPALAHIAVQDGNVFAVLHIDPGDSPIVGEPAKLHFDFSDSKEQFDVSKCDCAVTISSKGTVLFDKKTTEPEFDNDKESITLTYTFPEKAVYTIVAYGKTSNVNSVATSTSFKLSYDIRVDRGNSTQSVASSFNNFYHTFWHHFSHIVIFGGAFVIGGYLSYRGWKKESLNKV